MIAVCNAVFRVAISCCVNPKIFAIKAPRSCLKSRHYLDVFWQPNVFLGGEGSKFLTCTFKQQSLATDSVMDMLMSLLFTQKFSYLWRVAFRGAGQQLAAASASFSCRPTSFTFRTCMNLRVRTLQETCRRKTCARKHVTNESFFLIFFIVYRGWQPLAVEGLIQCYFCSASSLNYSL